MLTTRARRAIHRCLTLLFALSLGVRLVAHQCPAHDLALGSAGHGAGGHGAVASAAPIAVAPEHAGHHDLAVTDAASEPSSDDAPTCTCAGDCLCAARDGCAPARPSITLAAIIEPSPRVVAVVPAPRTDRGARLLPFANGPPVTRALLA